MRQLDTDDNNSFQRSTLSFDPSNFLHILRSSIMWLWSRWRKRRDVESGDHETHNMDEDTTGTNANPDTNTINHHNFSQSQASGWQEANRHFKRLDLVEMAEYGEEVDTVLVFAGLFSAILTAFIVEVYKGLQEDPAETSAQILRRITMQLDNNTQSLPSIPSKIHNPSSTIVAINALWFSSLILSLFAALLAILIKQWLHVYGKWPDREQPKDTIVLRHMYREGFFQWHVPDIIGLLPVLLQFALLLFVIGLTAYMWTLHLVIAGILTVLVTTMIVIAIVTIALPFFSDNCPYKSPVGLVVASLIAMYSNKHQASDLSSWQRRDIAKAKCRLVADDVVAQADLILDISSRPDLESGLSKLIDVDSLLGSRISSLPEGILGLLSELVITSAGQRPKNEIDPQWKMHTLHLLQFIARVTKGDVCQNVAEAIIDIFTRTSDHPKTGFAVVWSLLQRATREEQQFARKTIWRCVELSQSLGHQTDIKSEATIRTYLHSMKIVAGDLALYSDSEISSAVENGLYNEVLDTLQHWIQHALPNGSMASLISDAEQQYRKLFNRHRAGLTKLSLLGGHKRGVMSAQYSPNGLYIVSGADDNTVRVWDSKTGVPTAVFEGHTNDVNSVAFSPDGSYIASGGNDNTVRVWDSKLGVTIALLEGHTDWIGSVTFSPDGSHIVSSSGDQTVRIWDWRNKKPINAVLEGHKGVIFSISLSSDGSRIISGSHDRTVRVWDWKSKATIAVLEGHTDMVFSVSFSPDASRIVSGSGDRTVRVWDSVTRKALAVLEGHTGLVRSVAFSPDGLHIISGSRDSTARVWDLQTGGLIATLEGHTDEIRFVAFSPDGSRIVSASEDKTVRVWNSQTSETVNILDGHRAPVTSVELSSDESQIVSCDASGETRTWNKLYSVWSPSYLSQHSFSFESGWLLLQLPNDDKIRRIQPIPTEHMPSTPYITHRELFIYGTESGDVAQLDLYNYLS